jgi:hypothetical protein
MYPDMMKMLRGKVKTNENACGLIWDYFVLLMQKCKTGCDDNDVNNIEEHAKKFETLSND